MQWRKSPPSQDRVPEAPGLMVPAGAVPARFPGLRALIVEDEALVALMMEDMLTDLGCEIVGSAATVAAALELADHVTVDVGLLDLNLGGELSYPVATAFARRGVPIIFATAYATCRLGDDWNRPVLRKPFTEYQLAHALAAATAARGNEL
jgi:CheY-like chemotaxis protein